MVSEEDLTEYLDEIRKEVCSVCVERPPGGPPCVPLGKMCGVEMHLPQLIEGIRDVHNPMIAPYLEHNRREICQTCTQLHSSTCPCPMDYLAVPLVEAVESVDERREQREGSRRFLASLLASEPAIVEGITREYEAAAGQWRGCDWPKQFGKTPLDLNGCTAADAEAEAIAATDDQQTREWLSAAAWLTWIERLAQQAEAQAARAVEAANAGNWPQAVARARWARALEFTCGRSDKLNAPLTWGPFCQAVEEAAGVPSLPVGKE